MVENGKTIFEKIVDARAIFYATPKQKTGYNPHLKSYFFTLNDIIPIVSKIETTLKMFFHITFEEKGVLTVYNVENPKEFIKYTTPFSINGLKGMSEIQAIGATETYSRRYLYTMALDVIETEDIDTTFNPNESSQAPQTPPTITKDQADKIWNSYDARGHQAIKQVMADYGMKLLTDLQVQNVEPFKKVVNGLLNG